MSELMKSGLFGMENQSEEKIITNWTNSGLLDGMGDDDVKRKLALTLEDGARLLLNSQDYSPYQGRFEVMVFPAIRRIVDAVSNGTYSYIRKGDYDEVKDGLVDMLTADYIIKKTAKLYLPTLEFFNEMFKGEKIDIEAEVCAFIAEKVTQSYIRQFNSQNIMKGDNGYFAISIPENN